MINKTIDTQSTRTAATPAAPLTPIAEMFAGVADIEAAEAAEWMEEQAAANSAEFHAVATGIDPADHSLEAPEAWEGKHWLEQLEAAADKAENTVTAADLADLCDIARSAVPTIVGAATVHNIPAVDIGKEVSTLTQMLDYLRVFTAATLHALRKVAPAAVLPSIDSPEAESVQRGIAVLKAVAENADRLSAWVQVLDNMAMALSVYASAQEEQKGGRK